MKVIIAPDKFKGSCPAEKAAAAIAQGWQAVFANDELILIPVADGGEGTLKAMRAACGGRFIEKQVIGPLGASVLSEWLLLADGTAVIEMARASGLVLVKENERDVCLADTFGTGQLMQSALDCDCRRFIIGIGGSATNDAGMGLLRALGARFFGPGGELVQPGSLNELDRIDFSGFDGRVKECSITVACDVSNPLCGPEGASAVYGPQKGAAPQDVAHMDECLKRLAGVAAKQMGFDKSGIPGAGAAGGLGWALLQCCGAVMKPGIDVMLDVAGFDAALEGAGLVITGEGSLDGQSAMGKAPAGIAKRATAAGVPVAAIAGTLGCGHEAVYDIGIQCAIGIAPGPISLPEAMGRAEELIGKAASRLARIVSLGKRVGKGQ
jgi:glycerate 2-kinase